MHSRKRSTLGADHLTLEGGGGGRDFWSSRILFLEIWWAGYFFACFPHKLSITFVLHAIFFFRQALAGNFFFQNHLPLPPQELNGQPLRAISEKRNRLRLAWFDMIIIEQCYLFRRGFTKEIAKIKLIQRDLKQADVISFRMEGRTQKQG